MVNPELPVSRLLKHSVQFLLLMFMLYRPGSFFFSVGSVFVGTSLILGCRFVYLVYLAPAYVSEGRTYLPSLIFLAVCAVLGFLSWALGIIGELIMFHRRVAEESLYLERERRTRK